MVCYLVGLIDWKDKMHKNYDDDLKCLVLAAFDKWYAEQVEKQKKDSDNRKFNAAMGRIFMKYKRIHSTSEYILNSVYTYSASNLLK